MIVEHKRIFCDHCDRHMFVCGLCGMNSCSGGHGEVDGKPCSECDNAYKLDQEQYK